ncbi:MAG: hypothetical protein ABTQ93_02600 [Candidatus Competibacter denitrificans]
MNPLKPSLMIKKNDIVIFTRIFFSSNYFKNGLFYLILFWNVPSSIQAIELADTLSLHGFLTQGYFLTSGNRIFGESDANGSLDFTEAGLNASWNPNADLRLAGQVLFRRAGTGHEHDLELDFGLLDYTIFSTPDHLLGTRFGRFKNPLGLYNDTRDVLFTRPTILLPQSIYLERTRDLALSADGGLLYGEHRSEAGNILLEIGAGVPRGNNLDTELAYFGADYPGETEPKLSYIGRLSYEREGGKYRAAISSVWLDVRYQPKFPASDDDLPPVKDIFIPVIFSMQYNGDPFSITAEYATRRIQRASLGHALDLDITGYSYYLQAVYQFDENWQFIARYDALYNNRADKYGKGYQAITKRPAYTQFATDWTFGVRYSLTASFLIAAEYHYINGTAWLPYQDNPDPNDVEKHWQIFSVATSFRF